MRKRVCVLAVPLFLAVCATVCRGSPWRAVAVRAASGNVELITEDGIPYRILGVPIPPALHGREILVEGHIGAPSHRRGPAMPAEAAPALTVSGVRPAPEPAAPVFEPLPRRTYAQTDRTLPEAELVPGGQIVLDLPEMGKSAASGGVDPIRMWVSLPRNYRRTTAHPVIVHFAGGRGRHDGANRWRTVVGSDNFILVGADYDHHENERRGMLRIGTCRDHESRIALHVLQILGNSTRIDTATLILSGSSSGAFSITDNLTARSGPWQAFAGFCAIGGGAQTESPRLGDRVVLFLMGEDDEARRHGWLREAVASLSRVRSNVTVHIVPGVGHSWDRSMDPFIREWLADGFPALAAVARRRALVESDLPPEAKAVVSEWIRRAGLE